MNTFERVRYSECGYTRTTILKNPKVITFMGLKCIFGTEVDAEGCNTGTLEVSERNQIIELAMVRKRTPLEMSNHYGRLVPKVTP